MQPIEKQFSGHRKNFRRPTSREIRDVINNVRPIPQIALKITRMIHDDCYNMSEVANEIKQDQIISARVIRLCNSAFIGLKNKIDSIDRAAVILGEKLLLQLVISASLFRFRRRVFPVQRRAFSACLEHRTGC